MTSIPGASTRDSREARGGGDLQAMPVRKQAGVVAASVFLLLRCSHCSSSHRRPYVMRVRKFCRDLHSLLLLCMATEMRL